MSQTKRLKSLLVIFAIALAQLVGLSSPAAAASTCVVDNFSDAAGSDADSSRTIRFCLGDVSHLGTISFSHGGSAQLIEIESALLIFSKTITIDGDGLITIKRKASATGQFSLLTSNAELYVDGITFRDGVTSASGGAIYAYGAYVGIENSEFHNNTSGSGGGAIVIGAGYVTNSIFTGNAALFGGAVYSEQDIQISTSTFTNNIATDGGAVFSGEDVVTLESLYSGNSATNRGGAIYAVSDVEPTSTSFISNTALDGGAIYVGSNDTDIVGSYFAFNQAIRDGGAIHIEEHIHISNSTFYQNSSGYEGAAVFNDDESEDAGFIQTSTFVDNQSGDGLSVIYWVQDEDMNLFGNLFLGDPGQKQLEEAEADRIIDFGWNVSSHPNLIGAESSNNAVTLASVGAGVPETATLSLRPIVPFSSLNVVEVEIDQDAIDAWLTRTPPDLTIDQQGTTRVVSYFPGAQYIAWQPAGPSAPRAIEFRPYEGPVIMDILPNYESTNEAKVTGLRMEAIDRVSVSGAVLSQRLDADGALYFDTTSLAPGSYRIEFWSAVSSTTLYSMVTVKTATLETQSQMVNAGSFKGYVAIYAKGYEGSRLSAKVGDDWVIVPIVPAAPNNLYRHVEYTGAGVDVAVRIYIDRVLMETVNLTTK
ncbi:MAG: hypothetical protein K9G13_06520 [Aquiluna sp.]|nr:hypothetical protein [Aquiluna sp.]MCF8546170.1 hypothetical protein [Aquiluna sp.]